MNARETLRHSDTTKLGEAGEMDEGERQSDIVGKVPHGFVIRPDLYIAALFLLPD